MTKRVAGPLFFSVGLLVLLLTTGASSVQAAILLVSDRATHSVLKFDAQTGAPLGTLVAPNSGSLFAPNSMTIGFGGDLFVTSIDLNTGNAQILRYNSHSGAFLGVFADTGTTEVLGSLLYSPTTNTLLAGSLGAGLGTSNTIYQYDSAGATTTNLVAGSISGRTGLAFGPEGNLYASTFWDGGLFLGSVLAFDTANNFAPLGYAVTPGFGGLSAGAGLIFDAQGDLYVTGLMSQGVFKYEVTGGVATSGGQFGDPLAYPSGVLIGPDGNLLISSLGNDNPADPFYGPNLIPGAIYKYDISTGATIDGPLPFIANGENFLPTYMLLVEDNSVPEPSSLLLAAGGAIALLAWRRRKRPRGSC